VLTLLLFLLCVAVFIWIVGGRLQAAVIGVSVLAVMVNILVRAIPFIIAAIVLLGVTIRLADRKPAVQVIAPATEQAVSVTPPLVPEPSPPILPEPYKTTEPSERRRDLPSPGVIQRHVIQRRKKQATRAERSRVDVQELGQLVHPAPSPSTSPTLAHESLERVPSASPGQAESSSPPVQPFHENKGPKGFAYDPNHR
jgi:hypothetical protein